MNPSAGRHPVASTCVGIPHDPQAFRPTARNDKKTILSGRRLRPIHPLPLPLNAGFGPCGSPLPALLEINCMKRTISLSADAPRNSDILAGEGILEDVLPSIGGYRGGHKTYWIWDKNVRKLWGTRLRHLGWPGDDDARLILFPAFEANKTLSSIEALSRQLVAAGADRDSALVAVGGGVTGDMVGFLASIYMRGIPHFQVPTTLLAQVDSSVGGKTGVDLPDGKNLLGSFHQPAAIWMDPRFLETLPPLEFRQGMAEAIKTAMLGDEALWLFLEEHHDAVLRRETGALLRIVSACCQLKAAVVESDEREAGARRMLNLGHSVGHALEKLSNFRIRHGDAVAAGMSAAAELSLRLGTLSAESASRLRKMCAAWELPTRIPGEFPPEAIIRAMQADKKRIGNVIHFILPVKIGEVADCDNVVTEDLMAVLKSLQGAAR